MPQAPREPRSPRTMSLPQNATGMRNQCVHRTGEFKKSKASPYASPQSGAPKLAEGAGGVGGGDGGPGGTSSSIT